MAGQSSHTQGASVVMEGPYAGADLGLARRGTAGVAVVSGGLSLLLFLFAAPGRSLGAVGVALGVLLAAVTLLAGVALARPERPVSFNCLAALHAAGVGSLGVLVWLTGGESSPQISLILLWFILIAAVHPTQGAVLLIVLASLSSTAPLLYDGASSSQAGQIVGRLAVWLFGAAIAHRWVISVRRDRLERERSERRAVTLARVDSLTGLGNRRAFDEALHSLVDHRPAEDAPLSLVVADLHCFKDVNDRFGHLVGDQCLQEVAASLHRTMRGADRIYRWGGDEFAILLPNVPGRRAQTLCERIAEAVAERCTDPEGNALELGCGSAELLPGMDAEGLLAAADLDLMAGKDEHGGRRFSLTDAE